MSEADPTGRESGRPDDEPGGVAPGAPGPSGTGEATQAGGDTAAPEPPASEEEL